MGKHSEVMGAIEPDEITFVSDNEEVVRVIEKHDLTSGHNPFDYTTIHFEYKGMSEDDFEDWTVDEVVKHILKKDFEL